jgi:hypothetical protein
MEEEEAEAKTTAAALSAQSKHLSVSPASLCFSLCLSLP